MWVVRGVTTISKGAYIFMTRGMPGATQVKVGSVPCPPAAWSLRFSSKIARYSGVSGADLASGQRGAAVRSHWPFKSGYLDSSNAWPLVTISRSPATGAATRATARAPEPIGLRQRIYVLPRNFDELSR